MEPDDDGASGPPDEPAAAPERDLLPSQPGGRTLLPSPVARAVSFATRSTGLAIRVGTVLGGYGFGAARATTLSSLELGRGILEVILSRAGKDVVARARSELGRADAETLLERSLESLHHSFAQLVFWTSTGFQLTGTALSALSDLSQLVLSFLDSFLGSTESSRAMASIITLIRREFNNPATGQPGERVGVVDLIVGLCGLAYLQRWCWRLIEEENRRLGVEETVWDVVVLDDGERVDVHEDSLYGVHGHGRAADGDRFSLLGGEANQKVLDSIQRHGAEDSDDEPDDGLPEMQLKRQIMQALPADTKVAISTETETTKTITVDIVGNHPHSLAAPPGVELVQETRLSPPGVVVQPASSSEAADLRTPVYRVVFRVRKNKLRSTEMQQQGDADDVPGFVEQIDDTDDETAVDADMVVSDEDVPPLPPPKPSPARAEPSSLEQLQSVQGDAARTRPARSRGSSVTSPTAASLPASRRPSNVPLPRQSPEHPANQKRPRLPVASSPSSSSLDSTRKRQQSMAKLLPKRPRTETPPPEKAEKKGGFRNALKKGSGSALSSLVYNKDGGGSQALAPPPPAKGKQPLRGSPGRGGAQVHQARFAGKPQFSVPGRDSSLTPKRDAPHAPAGNPPKSLTARALAEFEPAGPFPRSPSRASYISVHERRRDSLVSQTDTYSIHSADNFRPVSPSFVRTDVRAQSSVAKPRPAKDVPEPRPPPASPAKSRRAKAHAHTPSIYTLKTTDSQMSLVPYYQRSPFSDAEAIGTLRREGNLDGMFPAGHLLRNITRYMRFSSASYGSNFLKVLGIAKAMPILRTLDDTHRELRSFAHHTQSPANSILLSSFVDPQGGTDSSGSTGTGVPLVHYVSLDDESRAVVLSCRGTLGFEDVLTDMTCDYDDLVWRGRAYKVHKGVHASARRLLYGNDGRVLATIKAALEENPGYGLVLSGHSLGGAVVALLGVMLSEPAPGGASFVTTDEPHSRLLTDGRGGGGGGGESAPPQLGLPPGRPIHVYAYGPPGTMSASLRRATRGLITSVVHGNDVVPFLSLGVLHDLQSVALSFKMDNTDAKQEVRQRVWEALQAGLAQKWYNRPSAAAASTARAEDEQWSFAAYKTLRAGMLSHKLLPPGEVFVVETTRVLRRDAFTARPGSAEEHFGRPARRVVLKYVRDVEARFREVRFGATMLTDHSPAQYERALDWLTAGVVDA